jgi:hypothetical protein
MIDSCGWNRKQTFLNGKVLSPNETAGKENVREQDYHRDSNRGNVRDHGGAGNHRAWRGEEDAASRIGVSRSV